MTEDFLKLAWRSPRNRPKPEEVSWWNNCLTGIGIIVGMLIVFMGLPFFIGEIFGVIANFVYVFFLVLGIYFLIKADNRKHKKIAEKYDKENPHDETKEIWISPNQFILKEENSESEIQMDTLHKVIVVFSPNHEIQDGNLFLPTRGWGKFVLEFKNKEIKNIDFQLTNEKNIPHFIDILKSWYVHQNFVLKEKSYDHQQAQLLFQKEWEYEELNYMKEKLEIDTIY